MVCCVSANAPDIDCALSEAKKRRTAVVSVLDFDINFWPTWDVPDQTLTQSNNFT